MPDWVAYARLYRGMHHPTDVLGSVLLAACWLTATIRFVGPNADLPAPSAREPAAADTRATAGAPT
jgi:undecaprenyl-diphosphatase